MRYTVLTPKGQEPIRGLGAPNPGLGHVPVHCGRLWLSESRPPVGLSKASCGNVRKGTRMACDQRPPQSFGVLSAKLPVRVSLCAPLAEAGCLSLEGAIITTTAGSTKLSIRDKGWCRLLSKPS